VERSGAERIAEESNGGARKRFGVKWTDGLRLKRSRRIVVFVLWEGRSGRGGRLPPERLSSQFGGVGTFLFFIIKGSKGLDILKAKMPFREVTRSSGQVPVAIPIQQHGR